MDIEIIYKNGRYYADRNCPICGDKIIHSTDVKNYLSSIMVIIFIVTQQCIMKTILIKN